MGDFILGFEEHLFGQILPETVEIVVGAHGQRAVTNGAQFGRAELESLGDLRCIQGRIVFPGLGHPVDDVLIMFFRG